MKAPIIEIFSSIQGEGLWVGRPQVFVRFHGCRLHCNYCDTPKTHHKIHEARIEFPAFSKQFESHALEFSVEELQKIIARFQIPSLAITGGESLEHVDFLNEWLPQMTGTQILLETSGVEVTSIAQVLPFVDVVSMDLKIPSATGERSYWEEHRAFLEIAKEKATLKIVYDEKMTDGEVQKIELLLKEFNRPVYFQPVSPIRQRDMAVCLNIFQHFAEKFPHQVRFLPQIHKFLSIL